MALTPDQEREWIARLEQMGVPAVRAEIERGKISPHWVHPTATWLFAKEREAEERREASGSAQTELARIASEAAEHATIVARRANRRASFAIAIATISLLLTIGAAISIW